VIVAAMAVLVVLYLFLLGLLGLFTTFLGNLDVVVEYCGNDGNHVGLDDSRPHWLGASNPYVDDALEGQVPFPHIHHVFTTALLQNADQPLDSAINCENFSDACR
jgi:hypothetical protein